MVHRLCASRRAAHRDCRDHGAPGVGLGLRDARGAERDAHSTCRIQVNMQLDLSADEVTVLADVVDSALGSLREEVYKSEVTEYKDSLKQRQALLESVLQRLGGGRSG